MWLLIKWCLHSASNNNALLTTSHFTFNTQSFHCNRLQQYSVSGMLHLTLAIYHKNKTSEVFVDCHWHWTDQEFICYMILQKPSFTCSESWSDTLKNQRRTVEYLSGMYLTILQFLIDSLSLLLFFCVCTNNEYLLSKHLLLQKLCMTHRHTRWILTNKDHCVYGSKHQYKLNKVRRWL